MHPTSSSNIAPWASKPIQNQVAFQILAPPHMEGEERRIKICQAKPVEELGDG